ncbi:FAM63A-like protein (DUF544) [Wolffia australiana]
MATTLDDEGQREEGSVQELSVDGRGLAAGDEQVKSVFYKTKVVEFLGRSAAIVLQNDNGPCPLLAICNVLLLRNVIELSLDDSEVSQQKLLSLVAERLLDSNSNVEGKDEGYISNQQRNISDAIDLLPRLASGIDVNVLFRKIDDFEFTRECAIFDLLDIGLYHGWIVDPQDVETAAAIGSKSYNALVGELVAIDAKRPKENIDLPDEEPVDFSAATTAALGVPSPSLSRSLSFNDPYILAPGGLRAGKGDLEEAEELMRVLKLSEGEKSGCKSESLGENLIPNPVPATLGPTSSTELLHDSVDSELKINEDVSVSLPKSTESVECQENSSDSASQSIMNLSRADESISEKQLLGKSIDQASDNVRSCSGNFSPGDVEPLYEGEERFLDSAISSYQDQEPVYEGEMILGKHADLSRNVTSESQWHLSKNFLKDNASQLTVYGLFCLQEDLKERELCVFFRNNHFSTMFKYNGELYLLATDQGYINQQDLVWEKLNEVNGDTMFVRSNFTPFVPEDQAPNRWDEPTDINEFLKMEDSASGHSTLKSDHELAKELQQQEFDKQPQRQQTPKTQHPTSGPSTSKLIVGPQTSRHASYAPQKPDSKSKDKCTLM